MNCTGHTRGGEQCRNDAIKGATVCRKHGGAAPHVRRNAAVRAELMSWGLNDSTEDPGEVLLRLVTQSAHRAAFYASLLERQYDEAAPSEAPHMVVDDPDEEDPDDVFGGSGAVVKGPEIPAWVAGLIGHKYAAAGKDGHIYASEEGVRALVALEAQERERCARFAKTAIDAGIAERQVSLAERQGALIAEVLRAVLADPELGLTAAQKGAVPNVARRHLAIAN